MTRTTAIHIILQGFHTNKFLPDDRCQILKLKCSIETYWLTKHLRTSTISFAFLWLAQVFISLCFLALSCSQYNLSVVRFRSSSDLCLVPELIIFFCIHYVVISDLVAAISLSRQFRFSLHSQFLLQSHFIIPTLISIQSSFYLLCLHFDYYLLISPSFFLSLISDFSNSPVCFFCPKFPHFFFVPV